MWRDPVKSGIVFGGITLVYFIVGWSGLSAVDILAYVVLLATVGCLLWAKFGHMVPNLPKQSEILPKFLEDGITEKQIKDFVDKNYQRINTYIELVGKVAYGKDIGLSLKIVGVCMVYIYIISRISVLGIAYFGVLVAFTAPKLYEVRKDDCDKLLAMLHEKTKDITKLAQDQLNQVYKKAEGQVNKLRSGSVKKTE